ncbi:MAG: methyltransferase domain-containing protein [Methanobacteriaceae archaeon]|nr:methyltransferase domain-containing protein [Methanobacteriaceae archaeon]
MCHISCAVFGMKNLTKEEIKGNRVIEIGSYDFNGSIRSIINIFEPKEYIGVDISNGPGVDVICDAENLIETFGEKSFDIVISTELMEHVQDWRKVISNMKNICKENGIIMITTRSYGFTYHAYPYDFWRFELTDMEKIFSDFEILVLEKDQQVPGVFIKAKKPANFIEKDLSDHKLYNILANKRTKNLTKSHFKSLRFKRFVLRQKFEIVLGKIGLTYK